MGVASVSRSISAAVAAARCFFDLERFPAIFAIFSGTFDDPNGSAGDPAKTRHIFTRSIQKGVVLPAGIKPTRRMPCKTMARANVPTVFAHAVMPTGRD